MSFTNHIVFLNVHLLLRLIPSVFQEPALPAPLLSTSSMLVFNHFIQPYILTTGFSQEVDK